MPERLYSTTKAGELLGGLCASDVLVLRLTGMDQAEALASRRSRWTNRIAVTQP